MPGSSSRSERANFLIMAIASELGLLLIAVLAGWLSGHPAWTSLTVSFNSFGLGILTTLPLFVLLAMIYHARAKSLVQFRELIRQLLGKSLLQCNWLDLCVVALMAGVCEEFLFRGVVQPWLSLRGPIFGLVVCNLLFGFCHAITPTYFLFATLMGVYLSLTLWCTTEQNLFVPICCHSLYDLVAFHVVRASYRENEKQFLPNDDRPTPAKKHPNDPVSPVSQ